MKENLSPISKTRFEQIKAAAEGAGYTVTNKWRNGVKSVKLAPIVISEGEITRGGFFLREERLIAHPEKEGHTKPEGRYIPPAF